MTTVVVLRAAKDRIATPEAWHKGFWGDGRGARCLVGSLLDGAGGMDGYDDFLAAWSVVHRTIGRNPAVFNDHPDTTHADVLMALDDAIANEEAREQEFTDSPVREPVAA
jgi:hypothetical protein